MASGSAFGPAFDKEAIASWLNEPEEEISVEAPEDTPEEPEEPSVEPDEEDTALDEAPEEVSEEEAAPLPAAEETQEPVEAPTEEPEPLLLGRYKTPKDLENAYQELRGLQQRTAEEIHTRDTELEEMKALLRQAAEALQNQKAPEPPAPELVTWAEQQGLDPSALPILQQLADQAAQAKMAPLQEQIEAQKAEQARQEEYNKQVEAVGTFRSHHPDVIPDSDEDKRHAEVFAALREDPQINLQWNEETLEIAYEASKDPDFYSIIRANPALIDTDEGLDYARWQATLKKGTQAAQTQALKRQNKAERQAAAQKAHVETGGASPAGTPEAEDVVDIAFGLQPRDSAFFR